jgi:hypothetical protein
MNVLILNHGKLIAWLDVPEGTPMADLIVGSDINTAVAVVTELHNRLALEDVLVMKAEPPVEPPL